MSFLKTNFCRYLTHLLIIGVGGVGFGMLGVYLQNMDYPALSDGSLSLRYTGLSWSVLFFVLYFHFWDYILLKPPSTLMRRFPMAICGAIALYVGIWLSR